MATNPNTLSDRSRRVSLQPNDKLDGRGILHQLMAENWDLLEDLMDGTEAMRDRGERWLPKHAKEQRKNWQRRRDMSFLFGAFKEVLGSITAKPFATAVVVTNPDKVPERLEVLEKNPDRTGRNLTDWSKEVFRTAIQYGLTHVLVDFPENLVTKTEGRNPDLSEEDILGIRPRLIHLTPRKVIGWDTETNDFTGEQELVRLRILEERVERKGEFGDQVVEYVTVWTRQDVQRFRRAAGDEEFVPVTDEPLPHSFGAIPLVTFYANRTGMMTADPPLLDLADANRQHWQVASDFSNIMHVSRFAFLFATGVPKEEWDVITIGPNAIIKTEQTEAELGYVEQTGNAVGAGMADIEKLEERMERLGLNPLIRLVGSQTATASVINNDRQGSLMQAWAEGFERFLLLCYQTAAKWTDDEIPEDVTIEVFKDFDIVLRGNEDLRELREVRKMRDLTRTVFLQEIQRRGLISEAVDIEAVDAELQETEGAFMASLVPGPGSDDDPADDAATGEGAGGGDAKPEVAA